MGWAAGAVFDAPQTVIGTLFAFLAGAIMLNVLKEELPDQRRSRFVPFAAAALICGAALLLTL